VPISGQGVSGQGVSGQGGGGVPKRNGSGIELLADPTRRRLIAAWPCDPRFHGQITAWLAGTEIGRPTTRMNTGEDPNRS
jgi:hypothetical protein